MQRTLLASVIVMSLSACDGGILSRDDNLIKVDSPIIGADGGGDTTNATNPQNPDGDDHSGATTGESAAGGNSGGSDSSSDGDHSGNTGGNAGGSDGGSAGDNTGGNTGGSSDGDTGGSSGGDTGGSSGGNAGADDHNADPDHDDKYGEDDSDDASEDDKYAEDNDPISDDAGSSSSDGGESSNNDDTDSGPIDDDAGSSSSDGGETNDDSGSSSSDGGESSGDNTGSGNEDEFASDNVGGNVIRTSTLSTTAQQNICTTASAQDNFSDMRIGDFILHNNAWRPWRAFPGYEWEQCIYSNTNGAVVGWNYDWGPGQTGINGATQASGDFYVRSYPELIYGVKDEFRTSAPPSVTGFPIELAQLPNISIDYAYDGPQYGEPRVVDASNNPSFPNGTTISGERNVAIESFFYNKDAAGQCSEGIVSRTDGSNHVYEIMVWLDAGAERLPAGPSDFVTNLSIRGDDYKVYTKDADPRYIAFVAQNPQSTGTVYWNDFIDWAKDNAHQVQTRFGARSNSVPIQDDWCIANIIVGTEIFWGAGNLDIYNWTITQSE